MLKAFKQWTHKILILSGSVLSAHPITAGSNERGKTYVLQSTQSRNALGMNAINCRGMLHPMQAIATAIHLWFAV